MASFRSSRVNSLTEHDYEAMMENIDNEVNELEDMYDSKLRRCGSALGDLPTYEARVLEAEKGAM